MPEEDIKNQNENPSAVEDVFSEVDEVKNEPANEASSVSENNSAKSDSSPEEIDISENSAGQTAVPSAGNSEEKNAPASKSKNVNTGKILFYLILFLIIILGAFAVWALVF